MSIRLSSALLASLLAANVALAQDSQPLPPEVTPPPPAVTPLPLDEPTIVGGVDLACTGIGDEAQTDPRWRAYPIRVEFAGGTGQYLGDATLTLLDESGAPVFIVTCNGPWILLKLPPGKHRVTAAVAGAASRTETLTVPATGQARAVIRFPEIVGDH